jgi:hypothetical protein
LDAVQFGCAVWIKKTNTPWLWVYCIEHMDDILQCPQGNTVYMDNS